MSGIPAFLLERRPPMPPARTGGTAPIPFLERGLHRFSLIVQTGYAHWESSTRDGLLQRVDARVKVPLVAFLLVVVSLKRAIAPQAGIAAFVAILFALSRIGIRAVYRRVLALGLLFGVLVPLPSLLNVLSGGEVLVPLLRLPHPYEWGFYRVPEVVGVTREGVRGIALLFLRVSNSVALSFLLLHTTPFPEVARALRAFRVPDAFVVVLALSYKSLFLFARTVSDMHLAKRSRLLGPLPARAGRRWVAERLAFLYRKTQARSEEIFKAMLSRGFAADVRLGSRRPVTGRDWGVAAAILGAGGLFLWW